MRVDQYLVECGLCSSRKRAQDDIRAGLVFLDGKPVKKPSCTCTGTENAEIRGERLAYVGRGGLKIEGALDRFGIDVSGLLCCDVGASTGGFTDCLLQRGAAHVVCVDCGRDQLAPKLRDDARVTNIEGFNARLLSPDVTGGEVDFVCSDVSFISVRKLLQPIYSVLKTGGTFVTLIKPQFEAGREQIGKGGIVRSEKARFDAALAVINEAQSTGFSFAGVCPSPIPGGDGNLEFLAYFKKEPYDPARPLLTRQQLCLMLDRAEKTEETLQ